MAKKISVIYRTYNNMDLVRETIESVIGQTETHWELLLIDDASTDQTKDEIETILSEKKDGRIKYIRLEEYLGKEKAFNYGVSKAKGEFLSFVIDGAIWDKHKLATQLDDIEQEEAKYYEKPTGIAYGYLQNPDGQLLPSKDRTVEALSGSIFHFLLVGNPIQLSTVMMRRDIWAQFYGLREDMKGSAEGELFLRITREYNTVFTDMELVYQRAYHPEQVKGRDRLDAQYLLICEYFEYYKVFDMIDDLLAILLKIAMEEKEQAYYLVLVENLKKLSLEPRLEQEEAVTNHILQIHQLVCKYVANLLTEYEEIVGYYDNGQYQQAQIIYEENLQRLRYLDITFKIIKEAQDHQLVQIAYQIRQDASGDDNLISDMIQNILVPRLEEVVSGFLPVSLEDDTYSIEPTQSGYYTIKVKGAYFHTNRNPMIQERKIAKDYFDPMVAEYNIFGAGLGYQCVQIFRLTMGTAQINLYEPDENMIQFGYTYGVLGDIPKDILKVTHDPTGEKFLLQINNNTRGSNLHYRTIRNMDESISKEALLKLSINYNTIRDTNAILGINHRMNRTSENYDYYLDDFIKHMTKKETVIVAAGPSLDDNLDWLKEQKGKMNIVAVTTILKKLLDAGIEPDFCFVLDAKNRTYGHMRGIKYTRVPMVVSPHASWCFGKYHKGKRYLVEYKDPDKNRKIQFLNGSVTTLAIQATLETKTETIYLVGADFAFVGGYTHSKDTMDLKKIENPNNLEVEAVGGGMVETSMALKMYCEEVEKFVAATPRVKFVNLSQGGARIKGTQEGL